MTDVQTTDGLSWVWSQVFRHRSEKRKKNTFISY